MASLPTETLLRQLADLGVETDRDRFVELARRKGGAWAVSDEWREELGPRGPEDDRFLGLAATELWLRWLPEVPCVETVGAQIAREYRECTDEEPLAGIVARWRKIWADAAAILPDEVRTVEEASAALPMHYSLKDWLGELGDLLVDAAAEDESFGPEAERFIVEIRERFRGDRSDHRDFLLSDHANLVAGFDPERAEAMLRAAVAERPDDSAPVVILADFLARDGSREGLSQAIEVLDAARAGPMREEEGWSIEDHLADFRRVLRTVDASPRDGGT